MKYGVLATVGLVLLSLGAIAPKAVEAEEIYTATLTAPQGLSKKIAELTISFSERTSDEEAARLIGILQEQGVEAAMTELKKTNLGKAEIKNGYTVTVNLVRVHPGENGSRVIIMTSEPIYFPDDRPTPSSQPSVGFIELVVATRGQGRGTIAEAQNIEVTGENRFRVSASRTEPIDLENVVRVQ